RRGEPDGCDEQQQEGEDRPGPPPAALRGHDWRGRDGGGVLDGHGGVLLGGPRSARRPPLDRFRGSPGNRNRPGRAFQPHHKGTKITQRTTEKTGRKVILPSWWPFV